MACLNCTKTKALPTCSGTLVLGQVEYINQDVYIQIRNITTNRTQRQEATTSALGVVTLDLSDPSNGFYSNHHTYEVSVYLRDANPTQSLPITIGTDEYTCVQLAFNKIYDGAGVPITSPVQYVLQLNDDYTSQQALLNFNSMVGLQYDYFTGAYALAREWKNKGSGNNAYQSTNILQPSIVAGGLNNQDYVDFTGNEWMNIVQKTAGETSGTYFSIEAVVRPKAIAPVIWSIGDYISASPLTSIHIKFWTTGTPEEFGLDIYDGSSLNVYSSDPITGLSNSWNVLKVEYKDGDVQLYHNGNKVQSGSWIDPGSTIITSLPAMATDHYLGASLVDGLVIATDSHMRVLKVHTTEPSNIQKQIETLEMMAML